MKKVRLIVRRQMTSHVKKDAVGTYGKIEALKWVVADKETGYIFYEYKRKRDAESKATDLSYGKSFYRRFEVEHE